MQKLVQQYTRFCSTLKEKKALRQWLAPAPCNALDFSHNDYLGLSRNPRVLANASDYGQQFGTSSRASRLLFRDNALYSSFEKSIATALGQEIAIVFSSGFQANASVIAALLDKRILETAPLVFTDRLNHASMHTGCFIAQARQIRYHHTDYNHLEALLNEYHHNTAPKFILTESLFGMDGDRVNMECLVDLACRYRCFLYVDEAHAMGIEGTSGHGLAAPFKEKVHLVMGTLSKAYGAQGGFIATSKTVANYLITSCKGLIYSTAPSPLLIGAAKMAWELAKGMDTERHELCQKSQFLRRQLQQQGYDTGHSDSHIIPLIFHDNAAAMKKEATLLKHHIITAAIRPPSVPEGQSRLRLTLNATHTKQQLLHLLSTLGSA